jgi:predicted anti-sigma-YlaC factor YlaD
MAAAPVTPGAARARPASDIVGIALLVAAATQLLPGILATVSPAAFYDTIASYPPQNSHFLRDVGSWQIALGLLSLFAWRRPALRAPVLWVLAVQYTLHTVSHVIDVNDSDPSWQGPAALVLLALGAALFVVLAVREQRS